MLERVGFRVFLIAWNQKQGQKTPDLHMDIAQWLEARWEAGDVRMLLMAFRSAGKSTLIGLFAAWLLYRDSNRRILVLGPDYVLARKMVRNVRRILERHPFTQDLKPQKAEEWAGDSFTLRRTLEQRDPSMLARGVTSNITGSRADIVICDDVEVPNTCDTAEKREALRARLREMVYVLAPGGAQIYVGTPHHYYSIYADEARKEVGEDQPFLNGFERLVRPILTENGTSAWPERYPLEAIERIKADTGPNKFISQMMLQPINILNARLDVDYLQYYNSNIEISHDKRTLYLGSAKIARISCFWDPSTASNAGDDSVLAVVLADEGDLYYLHHVEYIRVDKNAAESEQTQQCRTVARIAKAYHARHVVVEDNGLGKFLPTALREQMAKDAPNISAQAVSSVSSKAVRILEQFDALLAARRLFVHERVTHTAFVREMREWRPEGRSRDDALDAVAGALALLPDAVARSYSGRSRVVRVRSEFDP